MLRRFATRLMLTLAGAAVLLLIASLLAPRAGAHGDAAWIAADARYVDRNGTHCCGTTDCRAAEPGEIVRISGGWRHQPTGTEIQDGERGVYPSERGVLFFCARGGALKCVFPAVGI